MKFKIIVDSSSNLTKDYLDNEKDIGFAVAPLTISFDGKEYVDNEKLDVHQMLIDLSKSKDHARSSCPSPQDFLNHLDGATYYFIYTISSKLSGSFNSALIAKESSSTKDNVFVLDSKLVCGSIEMMVIKTVELIKQGLSFEKIKEEMVKFRDSMNLLFILNKYDNLVKNGRMSKVVAFVANLANIKPLCYGEEGEIKIKEKIRTVGGALKRLVFNIGKMCKDISSRVCIISYTECEEVAVELKEMIKKAYNFKEVKIVPNRGLAAFYSLEGGIICCF